MILQHRFIIVKEGKRVGSIDQEGIVSPCDNCDEKERKTSKIFEKIEKRNQGDQYHEALRKQWLQKFLMKKICVVQSADFTREKKKRDQ